MFDVVRDVFWIVGVVLIALGLLACTTACYLIGVFWRGRRDG